jgi:hypothetical protein
VPLASIYGDEVITSPEMTKSNPKAAQTISMLTGPAIETALLAPLNDNETITRADTIAELTSPLRDTEGIQAPEGCASQIMATSSRSARGAFLTPADDDKSIVDNDSIASYNDIY